MNDAHDIFTPEKLAEMAYIALGQASKTPEAEQVISEIKARIKRASEGGRFELPVHLGELRGVNRDAIAFALDCDGFVVENKRADFIHVSWECVCPDVIRSMYRSVKPAF